MSPDIEGSINPWNLFGERHKKPKWKHDEYETPFAAISSFLELWPGDEQTSECDISERHLRLIETMAGYPEILVGRRPLDMPLHSRSKLAFHLSSFLDQIHVPVKDSEWHSLRSFLLHADLVKFPSTRTEGEQVSLHVACLHFLIKTIRNGCIYEKQSEYADKLHPDENRLLTALHSKSSEHVGRFWPLDENGLSFKREKVLDGISLHVNDGIDSLQVSIEQDEKPNYIEHTFRLSKVHEWINKWSKTELIRSNTAHNLVVGASAFLESTVAKMRSKILDVKRPGSIIVDGGGKITYLSSRTEKEEKDWMEHQLLNILMKDQSDDPEKESHHPFRMVISKSIREYGSKCEGEREKYLQSVGQHNISQLWNPRFPDVPTFELYKEYIGPKVMRFFLPPISINESDDDQPIWLFEESFQALKGRTTKLPWQSKTCLLCNEVYKYEIDCSTCNKLTLHKKDINLEYYSCKDCGSEQEPVLAPVPLDVEFEIMCDDCGDLTAHRKDFQKDAYCCNSCGNTQKKARTPLDLLEKYSGFVCQFHSLIYDIGEMTIRRQTSFVSDSANDFQSTKDTKIQSILIFDGNSIGKIFIEKFKKWNEPKWDNSTRIWKQYQREIIDTSKSLNGCIGLIEEIRSIEDKTIRKQTMWDVRNRRLQAVIRKQRRSFSFNAGWWFSIAQSISEHIKNEGNGITPWIVAGDDTVFACHSENTDDVHELLKHFHSQLRTKFPGVPLTFAGSVHSRGELTIQECYNQASKLEKIAANAWKYQIGLEHDLLTEEKKEKLEKLRSDEQKWDVVVQSARWANENGKLIGVDKDDDKKSLILFNHWNDHSSS